MPDANLLLIAVAVAATVTALAILALRLWNRPAWLAVGGAAAVAVALLVGGAILDIWPRWSLAEDRDRYLLLLLPAVVAAELTAALAGKRRWFAWLARGVVAAAVTPVLLWGTIFLAGGESSAWTQTETVLWLTGSAAALLGVWAALLPLASGPGGTPFALGLAATVGCGAVTIMLSGCLTVGAQGFPLAGALLGVAGAGIGAKPGRWTEGWLGVALVLFFGLLVRAHWLSELPLSYAVPLWLAPLLAWVPELPALRQRPTYVRGGLRTGLVAVPVALVLLGAWMQFIAPTKTDGREGGTSAQDYLDFGK